MSVPPWLTFSYANLSAIEEDRDVAAEAREEAEAERERIKDRLRTAKRDLARAQKDLQDLLEELRLRDQARKCCYVLRG